MTRDDIIKAAYRKLGYLAIDQTLSATELTIGAEALNNIVQLLETDGMPLWKRLTTVVNPSVSSQVYTITGADKIAQVFLKDTASGTQYDLIEKSLYDFNRLPQQSPGTPVHYTAQPTIGNYTVSIWPILSDAGSVATKTIGIVYQSKFTQFTSGTDAQDFPGFWNQALIYGTAVALAPETGYPLQDRQMLMKEFETYKKMASDYGDEDGSFYMQVDYLGHKKY
jgi:hypothetical protein